MNKRYSNYTDRFGTARVSAGSRFIPGQTGRECKECFGVGGHFAHCDKTR